MTLNLKMPESSDLKPRITVFGVGGAGGNAVNNMIRSNLEGVEFVVANTDAQALNQSAAERRIQIGTKITEGLGAGSRPEVGSAAAEESLPEIVDHLSDAHMVFITAGMGGGTGTGAAPVIARAARDKGILTVGVVTKPFQFEGSRRQRIADEGINELHQYVDTLIIIPNQNLFRIANEKTTFADAFAMADEVLHRGVRGITDLMVMPGLINLDFADVRAVMSEMGKAMMGTGEASGEKRALDAAEAAISNPLLDEVSMRGAKGVLINITGGMDLTLFEVDEAANRIRSEVDPDANIIVGSTFEQDLDGIMRVSVVATGITGEEEQLDQPVQGNKVHVLKHRPEKKGWMAGHTAPSSASMTLAAKSESEQGADGPPVDRGRHDEDDGGSGSKPSQGPAADLMRQVSDEYQGSDDQRPTATLEAKGDDGHGVAPSSIAYADEGDGNGQRTRARFQNLLGRVKDSLAVRSDVDADYVEGTAALETSEDQAEAARSPRVSPGSGLGAASRPVASNKPYAEDQLEIPAFLRRLPAK